MPSKLYNKYTGGKYKDEEEMLTLRKKKDNEKNKIRYWRNKYGYDLKHSDYEEFNKYVNLIKYIYDIHDFFINWKPEDEISREHITMYINKHKDIKNAYHIQDYVKTLKKKNLNNDDEIKPDKYIIEF